MIDMKQIKENVSNRIKPQHQAETASDYGIRENKSVTAPRETAAAIGASIRIKGDVTGDENLVIQGHVEGTIKVQGHVTISKTGKVKANIEAKQVIIEGELEGDMHGEEKVIIRESGNVHGNIVAPRVTLEDGAMFKGSIEMEPRQKGMTSAKPASSPIQSGDNPGLKTA